MGEEIYLMVFSGAFLSVVWAQSPPAPTSSTSSHVTYAVFLHRFCCSRTCRTSWSCALRPRWLAPKKSGNAVRRIDPMGSIRCEKTTGPCSKDFFKAWVVDAFFVGLYYPIGDSNRPRTGNLQNPYSPSRKKKGGYLGPNWGFEYILIQWNDRGIVNAAQVMWLTAQNLFSGFQHPWRIHVWYINANMTGVYWW